MVAVTDWIGDAHNRELYFCRYTDGGVIAENIKKKDGLIDI